MQILSSALTETRPEKKGFTEERHDVLLALSLLKGFALGFDEPSSELMDLLAILSQSLDIRR